MVESHPLDRPVWNALRGRQSSIAVGSDKAVRMFADHGHFAAAADLSAESNAALLALIPAKEQSWIFEAEDRPPPQGLFIVDSKSVVQMVANRIDPAPVSFYFVDLTEDDATDMRELACLARPGPFLTRTHLLGSFVGVKDGDRLLAMAGERLTLDGFTEISAVCTRRDHRGLGLAGNLVRVLANRMVSRGDVPFLHAFEENKSAIALYRRLGFTIRAMMRLTVLSK